MQFVPDNHFALTKIHTYMVHCSLIFVVALFLDIFVTLKMQNFLYIQLLYGFAF